MSSKNKNLIVFIFIAMLNRFQLIIKNISWKNKGIKIDANRTSELKSIKLFIIVIINFFWPILIDL